MGHLMSISPLHILVGARRHLVGVLFFSSVVSLLMLAPTIYMLQVYDRVIPSRNIWTLGILTSMSVFAIGLYAVFDFIRTKILTNIAGALAATLRHIVFRTTFDSVGGDRSRLIGQGLVDIEKMRVFIGSQAICNMFDLPFVVVFTAVAFAFDFWVGIFILTSWAFLVSIAFINHFIQGAAMRRSGEKAIEARKLCASLAQGAESIYAMGMSNGVYKAWSQKISESIFIGDQAVERGRYYASASKFFRLLFQSLALGLGAILVIEDQITGGMMMGCTILLSRCLGPVDGLISSWKQIEDGWQSMGRLAALCKAYKKQNETAAIELPKPIGRLRISNASFIPDGLEKPIVESVSFNVEPGSAVLLLGPSGSGKSVVARLACGACIPATGSVRFDGAEMSNISRDWIGPYLGYMSQDVQLFDGSVAENICRFGEINSSLIVEAAMRAGIHEMILSLRHGYETHIQPGCGVLSGGQRQRIGLARAIYGSPKLIVLDEPNSNLDDSGEQALLKAISCMKTMGASVIVVSHKTSILGVADFVALMNSGRLVAFGKKEDVFKSSQIVQPLRTAVAA